MRNARLAPLYAMLAEGMDWASSPLDSSDSETN
jgi:hypothetical protein